MRADIILVRHARSAIPHPGGPDDFHRPLTEAGIAQAERLAADLAAVKPSLIASSPYRRAVQTIEPFARATGMPIRTEHELREWDSGLAPTPDYAGHYAESWATPHTARPNAESLHQLTRRATTILTALAEQHTGGPLVVSSHGTFIARALLGFGLHTVDWPFSHAMPMPAVYRLRFTGTRTEITGPATPDQTRG